MNDSVPGPPAELVALADTLRRFTADLDECASDTEWNILVSRLVGELINTAIKLAAGQGKEYIITDSMFLFRIAQGFKYPSHRAKANFQEKLDGLFLKCLQDRFSTISQAAKLLMDWENDGVQPGEHQLKRTTANERVKRAAAREGIKFDAGRRFGKRPKTSKE
jgi:hypothetical protein